MTVEDSEKLTKFLPVTRHPTKKISMVGQSNPPPKDDSATESFGTTTKTDGEVEGDAESPPDLDSSFYSEGEKVLAYHQGTIYYAKIIGVKRQDKEWRYFVHYVGWNKSWDEWIGMDRLLKDTEENIQKQKANNEKQDSEKKQKLGRMWQLKPKTSNGPRGRKRKSDSTIKVNPAKCVISREQEKKEPPGEKLVTVQIPPTLKKQLIDDSEFVTHLGKLVRLPRSPNVQDILQSYLDYRLKKDGSAEAVKEITSGLCSYFDKALPAMLLYKSERQQYEETVKAESPSSVYGAEHLLRLFVKLPELLSNVTIEEETLVELQQNLVDLLRFLVKNQSSFFLSSYHSSEEEEEEVETSTNKEDGDDDV